MIEYAKLTPGRGFSPTRFFGYYAMRLAPFTWLRMPIASGLAALTRWSRTSSLAGSVPTPEENATLAALGTHGLAQLPPLLSGSQIAEIRSFLAHKELVAHDGKKFMLEHAPAGVRRASYPLSALVDCPHVMSSINAPEVLRVAERYLGCPPTISSLGIHWSLPSATGREDVQQFHRDADDWRFLKLFVYLTDVDDGCGPHEFVMRSHKHSGTVFSAEYPRDGIVDRYGPDSINKIVGRAGTTFIADTWGIHRGVAASSRPRLMLQAQYSILPVFKFNYRPVSCSPAPQLDRYINRLLITSAS